MKKIILTNLSSDGQRKKRTMLALDNTKKIDTKEYHKKRYAKVKKAREALKAWVR